MTSFFFAFFISSSLTSWRSKMISASGSRRKVWWECPAKQVGNSSSNSFTDWGKKSEQIMRLEWSGDLATHFTYYV